MQVLVVEDNDELCEMVASYLKVLGHEATMACDGAKAISLAKGQDFAMVITDIYMPNRDGFEVIRYFRERAKHTRIIAMSGMVDSFGMDCLMVAKRFGAHAVLEKPFPLEALEQVLLQLASDEPAAEA